MSLGALRSDNAKDRWDSRVQEACVDFWARGHGSWILNWGSEGRAFTNIFWIRNPYADQMQALKPGRPGLRDGQAGLPRSRARSRRYIATPEEKWLAVEGDEPTRAARRAACRSSPTHLREKLARGHQGQGARAGGARDPLASSLSVLKALTPSRDEAEERARKLEDAKQLVDADRAPRWRGAAPARSSASSSTSSSRREADLEAEVRKVLDVVMPMSIKASDKVKKVARPRAQVVGEARRRAAARRASSRVPQAQAESFVREVLHVEAPPARPRQGDLPVLRAHAGRRPRSSRRSCA